jgi:hypothetical protein
MNLAKATNIFGVNFVSR